MRQQVGLWAEGWNFYAPSRYKAGLVPSFMADTPVGAGDTFDRCIGELAQEVSLTRREQEIFAYLARGRSAPFIAEDLVISENTVWAHIKKVYAKFDVHTKQEIMSMVEDRMAGH